MTTVIFVRHAQSLHPYSDERTRPLTDEGMADRRQVLDILKGRSIDAFLCSPYTRSLDTIRPLAEYFGMDIITDERFRERQPGMNALKFRSQRWADFSFAEEGGESMLSLQKRNIEALTDVLHTYAEKTVVIGTHGTALGSILSFYTDFGHGEFLRIVNMMPYIIELYFNGDTYIGSKELGYKVKDYQKTGFSKITACGGCCDGCAKKADGRCKGCIESDGYVPEWKESGRCRIHACTREHGVSFCGLCSEFPCDRITELMPWNKDIISHLTYLRDEYIRQR